MVRNCHQVYIFIPLGHKACFKPRNWYWQNKIFLNILNQHRLRIISWNVGISWNLPGLVAFLHFFFLRHYILRRSFYNIVTNVATMLSFTSSPVNIFQTLTIVIIFVSDSLYNFSFLWGFCSYKFTKLVYFQKIKYIKNK